MTVNVDIRKLNGDGIRKGDLLQHCHISVYLLWRQRSISLPVADVINAHERTCPVRSFACSRCSQRGLLSL